MSLALAIAVHAAVGAFLKINILSILKAFMPPFGFCRMSSRPGGVQA